MLSVCDRDFKSQMNRLFFFLLLVVFNTIVAQACLAENALSTWPQSAKARLQQVLHSGKNELYVPAYTWHNRYQYTRSKINHYNELPWGGGLGKSLYDEHTNWHAPVCICFS